MIPPPQQAEDVLPQWINDSIETCKESWCCPIYTHLTDKQLKLLGKPLCFMEREFGRDWKCESECRISEECKRRSTKQPRHAPGAEFTDAENKWCDDYAAAYNRGFDAGAKAEREWFGKGLIEYSNRMGIYNCEEAVGDYLESLRSPQQQAGDQHE